MYMLSLFYFSFSSLSSYSFSYSLPFFSSLSLLLFPLPHCSSFSFVFLLSLPLYRGADIESRDTDSYTPLLTAAAYGQLESMKALKKANALTDVFDRNGKTFVFIAAEEDQVRILEVIQDMY